MKRIIHFPLLIVCLGLVGVLFLATGCEDNLSFSRKVTFTAAGGYQNGSKTKTAYSDDLDEDSYERIDWVTNDLIRVMSDVASTPSGNDYADYKVTGVSGNTSRISNAEIASADENGLNWGSGTNTFYALYPSPATTGVPEEEGRSFQITTDGAEFTGFIPATQTVTLQSSTGIYQPDMRYAFMWAATATSATGNVNLAFQPAMTALEFTIGNPESGTMKIKKLQVQSNTQINGTFTGKIAKSSLNCSFTSPGKTAENSVTTVNFSTALEIPSGGEQRVTVLAIPRNLGQLTVTLTLDDNTTRTLQLKDASGNWKTFSANRKYHVVLSVPTTYEYTFEVTWRMPANLDYTAYNGANNDYTVTSNRNLIGSATKKGVAWHAEFRSRYNSNTTGSSWTEWTNWSETAPDWLYYFTSSQTGDQAGSGAKNYRAKTNAVTGHNVHSDILRARTVQGTKSSPYDLSKHTITGGSTNETTANCYIVSAPGWYMFPLVYGNARKNGSDNEDSYDPSALTAGTNVLKPFRNHNNTNITSPVISDTHSAQLVWQDARNLVSDIGVFNTSYIRFYVSRETISQGNAVIAAKNSSGTVLWSWHIWVTDQTFSDVSLWGSNFMPVNLGWCDGGSMTYETREVEVRFIQDVTNTVKGTYSFTQNAGNPPHSAALLGNCPYYQWGRKDPMLPAKGTADNVNDNKTYYLADGESRNDIKVRVVQTDGHATIGWCIQHPEYLILSNDIEYPDWIDDHYNNLWNTTSAEASHTTFVSTKGKTVYDPCPPGYIVPPTGASTLNATDRVGIGDYDSGNNWFTYSGMNWPVVGCRLLLTSGAQVGGAEVNDGGQKVTGYGNYAGGYGKLLLSTPSSNVNTCLLLWGPPQATTSQGDGGDYKKKLGRYWGNGKASATPVRCIKE